MASTQLATQKANIDIYTRKLEKIGWKTFHSETYFT